MQVENTAKCAVEASVSDVSFFTKQDRRAQPGLSDTLQHAYHGLSDVDDDAGAAFGVCNYGESRVGDGNVDEMAKAKMTMLR